MKENEIIQCVIEKLQQEKPKSEYAKMVLSIAINDLKKELNGRDI